MIKKSLALVGCVLALAACKMEKPKPINLDCGGHNITVLMNKAGDSLTAIVDSKFSVIADQAESASGARYVGEVVWGDLGDTTYIWQLQLWNKGEAWMASIDLGFDLACTVVEKPRPEHKKPIRK
jgi:membrane-bound inhibitor of C-type lysozyme